MCTTVVCVLNRSLFPRAQPGGNLSSIQASRKRKLSDYQSSNTNAASTLPTSAEDREDLAWVMCVLLMATRQLALVNKTGQATFEINVVCRVFVEWIRNIINQHFMPFFSAMLFLSYDRVIAGYLTRQVATTFMATCARHYAEADTPNEANTRVLLDMETAPVTLQTCNLAISNAITHMVDTNLILVNQIIRDRLKTPVIPIEVLVSIMKGEIGPPPREEGEADAPVERGVEGAHMEGSYFEQLFSWTSQISQNHGNESECVMGYLSVPKLGTMEDYQSKEAFLESNFGVAKNNYYTYLTAIRECAGKSFDLTNFLSMEGDMMDFARFTTRLGVGGDGMLQGYHQQQQAASGDPLHTTYLFTQASQDPQQRGGIGRSWVNVIQHLVVTSLQGTKDLHADNMFLFGANLTEFILSRCAPVQSIPAGVAVYESYVHSQEEVIPLHTSVGPRPQYFVRTIQDHSALISGEASELPSMLGPHPPEDVMHLGSWIQLHTILHNGNKPTSFTYIPGYNGRPPELVMDRRYPLQGTSAVGTILLSKGNEHNPSTARVMIWDDEEDAWQRLPPVKLKKWWPLICEREIMVAPLVFRCHAAFRSQIPNGPLWVSIPFDEDDQFLDEEGRYQLARSRDEIELTEFREAHARLLPLGAHILVRSSALATNALMSTGEWVLGCLRYPDTTMDVDKFRVCVLLHLKEMPNREGGPVVVGVPPMDCRLPPERADGQRNVYPQAFRM